MHFKVMERKNILETENNVKDNESRKSPLIGGYTPITFTHSTPNKEIPLTKTMVDLQLHPNRPPDGAKKTIEVNTDNCKQKQLETPKITDSTSIITENLLKENKVDHGLFQTTDPCSSTSSEIPNTSDSKSDSGIHRIDESSTNIKTSSNNKSDLINVQKIIKNKDDNQKDENLNAIEAKRLTIFDEKAKEVSNINVTEDSVSHKLEVKSNLEERQLNNEKSELKTIKDQTPSAIDILKSALSVEEKGSTDDFTQKEQNITVIEKEDNLNIEKKESASKTEKSQMEINLKENLNDHNEELEISSSIDVSDTTVPESVVRITDEGNNLITNSQGEAKAKNTNKEEEKQQSIVSDIVSEVKMNKEKDEVDKCEVNKGITSNQNELLVSTTAKTENFNNDNIIPTSVKNDMKDVSKLNLTSESVDKSNIDKTHKTSNLGENKDIGKKEAMYSQEVVNDKKLALKNVGQAKDEINNVDLQKYDFKEKPVQNVLEDNKYVIAKCNSEVASVKNLGNSSKEAIKEIDFIEKIDDIPKSVVLNEEAKPKIMINNNAVPFGKWTEANRQEFLNKIKETKIPTGSTNTSQIKNSNDLNRRDVLMKIDSARQSVNVNSGLQMKDFTTGNKLPVKSEKTTEPTKVSSNKPSTTVTKRVEPAPKNQIDVPTVIPKVDKRHEINNQDLIDKTIEDILMDKSVPTRSVADVETKQSNTTVPVKENIKKPAPKGSNKQMSLLDDIEQQMNELHGIPFRERPEHELPHKFKPDVITYQDLPEPTSSSSFTNKQSSKIPKLLPLPNTVQQKNKLSKDNTAIDDDSDEEISECVPVTGDIEFNKKIKSHVTTSSTTKNLQKDSTTILPQLDKKIIAETKGNTPIITEREFDTFARRNSITYENQITVNIDSKLQHNVVQTVVEKGVSKYQKSDKVNKTKSHVPENQNKHYSSKLQIAYHSALTAIRQKEAPLLNIEDKPVKVVFMDSTSDFTPYKLNVQGAQLTSSNTKQPDMDTHTHSSHDSLDSEILDTEEVKSHDGTKIKTKHQRKQVLTPVEIPELELIEPKDLGIDISPKKKRKTDEFPKQNLINDDISKNQAKNVVPKKSYLLGRNVIDDKPKISSPKEKDLEESIIKYDSAKEPLKESLSGNVTEYSKKNTMSNPLDSLVKAAELLENQPEVVKAITNTQDNDIQVPDNQPMKRGRGRPRKYPIQDGANTPQNKTPSPQKKPKLNTTKPIQSETDSSDIESDSDGEIVKENWTMGKINENIVCPICNKLFRSENVVFKHVKHCTGPSPTRGTSSSDRSQRKRRRVHSKSDRNTSESQDSDSEFEVGNKSSSDKLNPVKKIDDDVVLIEDSHTNKNSKTETAYGRKSRDRDNSNNKVVSKTVKAHKINSLVCEFCGKTFRQLSYLVSHKLLHQKEVTKSIKDNKNQISKTVLSCEVCKKQFRMLHHLVQHRTIHNPESSIGSRLQRKISAESGDNKLSNINNEPVKSDKDHGAGFRCERCDKSFRKLHHLVEHRETHDGMNRLKQNTITQSSVEKTSIFPPQCDVCNKTFRKLHHLINHKEQHMESGKGDKVDKKGTLVTKDIIHECSLCYMVFPNEHSLNKHTIICERKKRQSKLSKQTTKNLDQSLIDESSKDQLAEENIPVECTAAEDIINEDVKNNENNEQNIEVSNKIEEVEVETIEAQSNPIKRSSADLDKTESVTEIPIKVKKIEESKHEIVLSKDIVKEKNIVTPEKDTTKEKSVELKIEKKIEIPSKLNRTENKVKPEIAKKKTPVKEKVRLIKKQKTASIQKRASTPLPVNSNPPEIKTIDLSDEDDVRYMLNPDYKIETTDSKLFMNVRAHKRNSLQIERPKSSDLVKRRISLQHPPKIPRVKTKLAPISSTVTKQKIEPIPSTSNDDDDEIKYSFPKSKLNEIKKSSNDGRVKKRIPVPTKKSLSGIAKRKSLGKTVQLKSSASKVTEFKKSKLLMVYSI